MNESIKIVLKQKSIPTLVDFCLEEKIEFNVRPQVFPDNDWEIELMVKDIKTAVMTGMFLRENRIEVVGAEQQKPKKAVIRKSKEDEEKTTIVSADDSKQTESDDKALF